MKRSKSVLLFTITAITTIFLAATTAQAVMTHPTPPVSVNTLNGVNGLVDIGEFEIDEFFDGDVPGGIGDAGMEASGGYFVDVLNGASVFGFAVSINSHVYPYTNRGGEEEPNWNAAFISAEDWDAGHVIGLAASALLTTDIGGFSSLFGGDKFANLYYNVDGANITNSSDTDQPFPSNPFAAEFFFSGGHVASHFVAFTSTGSITDQSLGLQPIPEPSTLFLFGTGIVGLIAHGLRKKSGIKA